MVQVFDLLEAAQEVALEAYRDIAVKHEGLIAAMEAGVFDGADTVPEDAQQMAMDCARALVASMSRTALADFVRGAAHAVEEDVLVVEEDIADDKGADDTEFYASELNNLAKKLSK